MMRVMPMVLWTILDDDHCRRVSRVLSTVQECLSSAENPNRVIIARSTILVTPPPPSSSLHTPLHSSKIIICNPGIQATQTSSQISLWTMVITSPESKAIFQDTHHLAKKNHLAKNKPPGRSKKPTWLTPQVGHPLEIRGRHLSPKPDLGTLGIFNCDCQHRCSREHRRR